MSQQQGKTFPCTNKDRGCTVEVYKNRQDGKYYEAGTEARHYCKFWPKKGENKTAEQVNEELKKHLSDVAAKVDKEVTANASSEKQYTNNEIMNEIVTMRIQIASIESAVKHIPELQQSTQMFIKEIGEALAKLSFEKANKLT